MKRVWAWISAQSAILITVAVVIAGAVYFVYQNGNGAEEILSLQPTPFLQEVSLSGRVIAESEADLGFAQGGRVERVTVSVGESVTAGDVLAEIENGEIVSLIEQRLASLEAEEAKLTALKQGTRPEEIAIAEADDASAQVQLDQARRALIDAIQDAQVTASDAVRVNADQMFSNPTSLYPQLTFSTSNAQTRSTVEASRAALEPVLTTWGTHVGALTTQSDINEADSEAVKNMGVISSFLSLLNSALSQSVPGSVSQSTLSNYAADVATARASVGTVSTALTTADTAYKSALSAKIATEKTLALKRAGTVQADVDAQEARVRAARASVSDARAQLKKTVITAPISGTVTVVDIKVGEVAPANTPVITVLNTAGLIVESFVPEINVALIASNDPARISLDAYGADVSFLGTVTSIDPAETLRDGVSTYRTIFTFNQFDTRVKAGMTASIVVTTDVRDDVLQIPQKVVVTRAGQKYVKVKVGEQYEERQVTVGAISSSGTIEILSGLRAGDMVVVVPKK
jgi:RND family efflux transporter MFP subunit